MENSPYEAGRQRAENRIANKVPSPFTVHDLRRSLGRFDIYQKDNSAFVTAYDSSDINQTPVYDGNSMSEAITACRKRMTSKGTI